MHTETTLLTIGELARQADVGVQTLRYYERRGLLATPQRSSSNYRVYPESTVRRVRFIRRAQELGFTLKEILELLALRAAPGACSRDVREQSRAKLADIDEKIATLQAMRKSLAKLVRSCSGRGSASECPILDFLDPEL